MPTTTSTQFEIASRRPKLHEVFWLEQSDAAVPAEDTWFSPQELISLAGLRFARRRADWRLGRWTAKCAVSAYLGIPALREIEIIAADDGAPQVRLSKEPGAVTVSLSHRGGLAMCVVSAANSALGCDLELVEPRSEAFITDYFTVEEQLRINDADPAQRSLLANLLWSAKESALKALRTGLRQATQSLNVALLDEVASDKTGIWHPLQVQAECGKIFRGWWQTRQEMVRTIVASPDPSPTPLLKL